MNENIICPHCGIENNNLNKFCIKCGNSLLKREENKAANVGLDAFFTQNNSSSNLTSNGGIDTNTTYNQANSFNQTVNNFQNPAPNTNELNSSVNGSSNLTISSYFSIIVASLLKPSTSVREDTPKFANFKNSLILSLIVTLLSTIVLFINNIISVVRVTNIISDKTTWVWDNLKDFNYFKSFGTNFLYVIGVIFAITCIYYLGSLIIKKNGAFSKMLFITTVSVVPFLLMYGLGMPLVNLLNAKWGIYVCLVGGVYSLAIFYENINNYLELSGNEKVYYNFVCLSIVAVLGYYMYTRTLVNSVKDTTKDILDWLN